MSNPLNKPVKTGVLPPERNPLDDSSTLHTSTQNTLAAEDDSEQATTPDASLTFTELEDDEQDDDSNHPSQSTLGGGTFHTTHRSTKMGDGDESQSMQITQTQRGAGHHQH